MDKLKKYNVVRQLCQATSGVVYYGEDKLTQDKVAIKVMPRNEAHDKVVDKEVFIIRQLNHPNIIRFIDVSKDQNYICLIFEYAEGGDLFELFRNMRIHRRQKMEEGMIRIIMKQILSALDYCYREFNVIHRDVKLENVFITGLDTNKMIGASYADFFDPSNYEKLVCKLGDFGYVAYEADRPNKLCGTKEYLSPEMVRGEVVDHKTDIWSLGIMIYECACGSTPFDFCPQSVIGEKIMTGEIDWTRLKGVSKQLTNLIYSMLKVDSKLRIDYPEIFLHPWFNQLDMDRHLFSKKRRNTLHY